MSTIGALKNMIPWPIRRFIRKMKRINLQRREARMNVKEVFTNIYLENRWGGKPGEFYSGPGSDEDTAKPYIDAVTSFIKSHSIETVLDIGCGDFRIGKAIADTGIRYTGMDIVEPLISRNKQLFETSSVAFIVGDVVEDELPEAELCLVREVFQHLSNDQIKRAIHKLRKFHWVIVTDHQPAEGVEFFPNRDKPHGQNIRLYDKSAIILDKPPFNVKGVEKFLDVLSTNIVLHENERLRSFLITNDRSA